MAEKLVTVRPKDRNATLDIALDGRSVRASHKEPGEVPADVAERLLESPTWERPSAKEPTIDEVLDDVGDDRDKAAAALAEEQAKGEKARKTLIDKLEAVIAEEAQDAE